MAAQREASSADAAPVAARASRFPLFDSLRAIAALSIVLYHCSFYVHGLNGPVTRYLSQHSAGFPAVGVVVFFAISGFLLYRPFVAARHDHRPSPALVPYAWRRVMRIVPAYWVALPVQTLVLGVTGVFTLSGVVTYFGFLQVYDVRTLMGGISQAWTLDVELTFYAALALVAVALRRRLVRTSRGFLASELGMCLLLGLGSIAWQVVWIESVSASSRFYYGGLLALPASFDLFAVGMMLAVVSVALGDRRPAPVRVLERAPWLAWMAAGAAYWVLIHASALFGEHGALAMVATHEFRGLLALGLLLPAVFGTAGQGWVRRLLGWRPLLWVGRVSYGVYLWHLIVLIELYRAGAGGALGPVAFVAIALTLTLALAAISWYGLERHAIALGRRIAS